MRKIVVLDFNEKGGSFSYDSNIEEALASANLEIEKLHETIDSVSQYKIDCDKFDYALAASSGALCGLMDIFLVGVLEDSKLGNFTDEWTGTRIKDFAELCGYNPRSESPASANVISWLEGHFGVPYDQTTVHDAAKEVFGINTVNHHYKSLAHNPTILGLVFSIINQFTNTSHFVSNGELLELVEANPCFELRGNNLPAKLFAGVVNWFGHLMSDISGSSGAAARGKRGMGIPSPLWTWCNDITVILAKLNIPVPDFINKFNELSLSLFKEGYDVRFQTTQAIPVFINELLVRLMFTIRRGFYYYQNTPKDERNINSMLSYCKPFSNYSVKRMLTVAHGTFCLFDITDATIRGFKKGGGESFDIVEFFLRFNMIGGIRFTISLYGEGSRYYKLRQAKKQAAFAEREFIIVQNYIEGLRILQQKYNDREYLTFIEDFCNNEYIKGFKKTVTLAELRDVPPEKRLINLEDIDNYFQPK